MRGDKMKKGLLVILLIACLMFSVSAVAAADFNDTAMTGEDEIGMSDADAVLESSGNGISDADVLMKSSNEEMLEASDDATFTALQNKINNASDGATITLDRDYTYDDGFSTKGIEINKDLTINGNGHTLNGLSKSRIFIMHYGKILNNNIVLNNIKFVNGYTDLYGGAIFNYADLTLNGCTFTDNHAANCGGAVNSVGHLTCNKCTFNKNTANGDAGAVFTLSLDNALEYFNAYYKNATIDGKMDFISSLSLQNFFKLGTDDIRNCVFNGNAAKGRGGGAVYAYTHLNVDSCTFKSNTAGQSGGAVFGNANLFIMNSKFTSNQVSKNGGAVYFKCHEQSGSYKDGKWVSEIKYFSNSIQSCVFTKNTAKKGGAIYGFTYSDSDKVHCAKAVKCTFEDNKASKGRDIYGGTASKCVFNYLKLTLKKVKIKKSAKKLVLTATLKKGANAQKSKKIKFKFNGKTYKAKTSKKGVAKVTIKKKILKKLKVGKKVKYQASYGKLKVTKTAKVKK
jgi:predicted outer membrane repeat protein